MLLFDDWHDYWRVTLSLFALVATWLLALRYRAQHTTWNTKTRDYWYSLVMWCVVGVVVMIQGVMFDYPLGPSLPITTAALAVTLRGLLRHGEWGGRDS